MRRGAAPDGRGLAIRRRVTGPAPTWRAAATRTTAFWLVTCLACGRGDGSRAEPPVPGVVVTRGYVVLPAGESPAALYATITNGTAVADTLTGVDATLATTVVLHGSMPSMAMLAELPVAAGAIERLAPGGRHGMITGLPALVRGDSMTLTFRFAHAGPRVMWAHVIAYADVDTAAPPVR